MNFTIFLVFVYQVWQSFASSQSLDFVSLRMEDDGAFHNVLRTFQDRLFQGDLSFIFRGDLSGQHFGYGWIFWFFYSVVTAPFYFLSLYHLTDVPLIASMSLVSLFFSFGALFFTQKILKILTNDWFVQKIIILTILACPIFGYLSVKWHPTSAVFFFSTLAVFFSMQKEPLRTKNFLCILLSLSFATSFKVIGLVVFIPIFLILIPSLRKSFRVHSTRKWIFFFIGFFVVTIFLINPSLITFSGAAWKNQVEIFSGLSVLTKATGGCPDCARPFFRFTSGIAEFINPIFFSILFVFGILFSFVKIKNSRVYRLFSLLAGLLILLVYLTFFVKFYVDYSFTPNLFVLSFILPVSFIAILWLFRKNRWKRSFVHAFLGVLFGLNLFLNFDQIYVPYRKLESYLTCVEKRFRNLCQGENLHGYAFLRNFESYQSSKIESALKIKSVLYQNGLLEKSNLILYMDFRLPVFLNERNSKNLKWFSTFDNINAIETTQQPDVIGVFKFSPSFLTKSELDQYILGLEKRLLTNPSLKEEERVRLIEENSKMFANWRETQRIVEKLVQKSMYISWSYKSVFENADYQVFIKE